MHRFIFLICLSVPAMLSAQPKPIAADISGSWQGSLVAARYDPVEVIIHITAASAEAAQVSWAATLDIPSQFRTGLPVASLSLREDRIILRLPALQAEFYAHLVFAEDGKTVLALEGDWSQSGENMPLRLERRQPR